MLVVTQPVVLAAENHRNYDSLLCVSIETILGLLQPVVLAAAAASGNAASGNAMILSEKLCRIRIQMMEMEFEQQNKRTTRILLQSRVYIHSAESCNISTFLDLGT